MGPPRGHPLRTAQRRFQAGDLPVPTFITDTGRLMVIVEEDYRKPLSPEEATDAIFDLKRQQNRLEEMLREVLARLPEPT